MTVWQCGMRRLNLPWNGPPLRPRVAAAGAFDFGKYMLERAQWVNKALDEAVPQKYPDVLCEAMRCAWDDSVHGAHTGGVHACP